MVTDRKMIRRRWGRAKIALFSVSLCSLVAAMLLLQLLSSGSIGELYTTPSGTHLLRHQFGRAVFFITNEQAALLSACWIVFGCCFVAGLLVTFWRRGANGEAT
jgi:hypothetical protein